MAKRPVKKAAKKVSKKPKAAARATARPAGKPVWVEANGSIMIWVDKPTVTDDYSDYFPRSVEAEELEAFADAVQEHGYERALAEVFEITPGYEEDTDIEFCSAYALKVLGIRLDKKDEQHELRERRMQLSYDPLPEPDKGRGWVWISNGPMGIMAHGDVTEPKFKPYVRNLSLYGTPDEIRTELDRLSKGSTGPMMLENTGSAVNMSLGLLEHFDLEEPELNTVKKLYFTLS